jgi:hypothetical protein
MIWPLRHPGANEPKAWRTLPIITAHLMPRSYHLRQTKRYVGKLFARRQKPSCRLCQDIPSFAWIPLRQAPRQAPIGLYRHVLVFVIRACRPFGPG